MPTSLIEPSPEVVALLRRNARLYETPRFIEGDPSWFMHQVRGAGNQEVMALMASCLSYGSRSQFMPKIGMLLRWSEGEPRQWLLSGRYASHVPDRVEETFYRLHTMHALNSLLTGLRDLLAEHGSLHGFMSAELSGVDAGERGIKAIEALTAWFARYDTMGLVPLTAHSACKRLAMMLRWMVRQGPVDLGLWANLIPASALVMPLDVHVLRQARQLGLLSSSTPSMAAAQRLTNIVSQVFPGDPLKADYALFGYGVAAG